MLERLKRIISPTHPLRLAWHFAWGLGAALRYGFPGKKLEVIGVTGTNGKTTTTNLIAKILEEAGAKVALATTINFQIGKKRWENLTKKTTLGRGEALRFLREAERAGCTHAILEVSSHGLIQHRLWGVNFTAAALTNITPEHLDFHGTMAEYRAAKRKLFELLARNPRARVAVLPADDENLKIFQKIPGLNKILTFGKHGTLTARDIRVTNSGQTFTLVRHAERGKKELKFKIETKLFGAFNIENILTASGVALGFDIAPEVIRRAVKKFAPLPGRLEAVERGQPFRVIVDFAHTPDALEQLLKTFRPITPGKLWLVFGATGDRDRGKRPVMGKIADQLADEIVVTSDDPYSEHPDAIIAEVLRGIKRKPNKGLYVEVERTKAIRHALAHAKKGDTVLLAGKGCEKFQIIGKRKIPWDEKKLAEKIIGDF